MTDARNAPQTEPTLADLEAFERLLRESLNQERATPPEPAPVTPRPQPGPGALRGETSAFAELTRLVEAPLPFEAQPALPEPVAERPEPVQDSAWPEIEPPATLSPQDPLLTFEDEMRRLEATMRDEPPQAITAPQEPEQPYAPQGYAPEQAYAPYPASAYAPREAAGTAYDTRQDGAYHDAGEEYRYASEAERQLAEADERLAMEAAAAAQQQSETGRSSKAFYALGGVAVVGLLAVGATFAIGGRSDTGVSKPVPVIAAKTDPAKEKPANPGGIEIPDQNKQILSSKTSAPDTKPAQVVNTTEQPVDLNQVAKRDAIRVIAPSPYPAQPAPVEPAAPETAAGEAKRVQSVKLSDPLTPSPAAPGAVRPAPPVAGVTPPARPVIAASATPVAPVTPQTPPAKVETRPATATSPAAPAPQPVAPQPRPSQTASAPKQNNAPLNLLNPAARPPASAPAPKQAANAPAAQPAAAPAPKVQPPRAAPVQVANAGGGSFAIQLASRPTEADARSASGQLASRYSEPLGGKPGTVVSGEVNGKTVYRVRVNGFAQADAVSACEKIKAAGGGCFVTRQ